MENSNFLDIARETGIEVKTINDVTVWAGETGGNIKSRGPLKGKKIGVIVASEFSDFQAYYLASYIGEFGGTCEFLLVDWVGWKNTRPNVANKGVIGMWGLSVDPIPVGIGNKAPYKGLKDANPQDYDALVIPGGHSADVMVTEEVVIDFIKDAYDNETVIGAIGEGTMPLFRAGIMNGKTATGSNIVRFMIEKTGKYLTDGVVVDGKLITARNTINTPEFLRALCQYFDSSFKTEKNDILNGKKVLIIAGEDYEDIELIVPTLEYIYRGAEVTMATFPAPMKARPPLLGVDVVSGNFGTSIPFQEIPESYYSIKKLTEVKMSDFDVVQVPGAFCPWNIMAAGEESFLAEAYASGKIIAAICHGPIPVSAANIVDGKIVTGWMASKDAVEIMGGSFKPEYAACIDGKLVTGRTPPELPEFVDAITEALLR